MIDIIAFTFLGISALGILLTAIYRNPLYIIMVMCMIVPAILWQVTF